ncbi:hypothetical protein LNV08_12600 [Paucibacter sp. TC2R-5]|uniref:DUF6671 family protein n=1 Tax=Paucibacter sp. TC2R-5 TaxID=2893555 RepID=UPI0021E3C3B9|nr:DUF6671 family protein [Paucibacter sp. TC2R-5]MCV2359811.1 hypothetical protein [Paucibacter sp. TC2R-5]
MARIALLTQHAKGPAMQGLAARLGHDLILAEGFDTDSLGTFTNERSRTGTQVEAALAKARLACELTGAEFGLGSEGSFGPDPHMGTAAWGVEVVVCFDAASGQHVHAAAQGPSTNYRQASVSSWPQASAFAEQIGFPGHGLIVGRPGEAWFDKELGSMEALKTHAAPAFLQQGELWLETDMRAHRNPTRMAMIEAAAEALAARWLQGCPACAAPGFGPIRLIPGALCECCAYPTGAAKAQLLACAVCGHEQAAPIRATVPAQRCEMCNP